MSFVPRVRAGLLLREVAFSSEEDIVVAFFLSKERIVFGSQKRREALPMPRPSWTFS